MALAPPDTDHGYSREQQLYPKARVVVGARSQGPLQAGVFDASGQFIDSSICHRFDVPLTQAPAFAAPKAVLSGTHLWGGVLMQHFGHALCEGTARLWASEGRKIDSVIYITGGKAGIDSRLQEQILAAFGLECGVTVIDRPTEVENLVVAGPGFGLGTIAQGTPEFRSFARRRFGAHIAARPPSRLYISRARLPILRGQFLAEAQLEANLAAEGYEIWHPQEHPLAVQIARLKGASHIIASDSSPLHTLALAGHSGQKLAIVLRRQSIHLANLLRQLMGLAEIRPILVRALVGVWLPERHYRIAGRMQFAELDFARLRADLLARDMIPGRCDWQIPQASDLAAQLDALAKHAGAAMRRLAPEQDPDRYAFQHKLAAFGPQD